MGVDRRSRRINLWPLCLASLLCIAGALSCTPRPAPSVAKPAIDSPTGWDLVLAASGGELERVRYLISRGVQVDGRYPADGPSQKPARPVGFARDDELNWTALQSAAANGHEDVVKYLLSVGANPNFADAYGQTPLILAIRLARDAPTALALIKAGAAVNTPVQEMFELYPGTTPLHLAVRYELTDVAIALAAAGAELTAKDAKGQTPLDLADFGLIEELKSAAAKRAPATQPATTQASGAPVSNGLALLLRIDKSQMKAGDEIEFTAQVENVTDHEIWANFRYTRFEPEEVAFYVSPADRVERGLRGPATSPFEYNRQPFAMLFQPDEAPGLPAASMAFGHFAARYLPGKAAPLVNRYKILRPGIYRMTAVWTSRYSANNKEILWKGDLRSDPVVITVFPAG